MSDQDIQYKQKLDGNTANYLDLWKYFTDDTAKIKDKMWTMASFFYTLLGALLGYIGNYIVQGKMFERSMSVSEQYMMGIVSIIGCLLSGFAMFMTKEYGDHVKSGWNRANYLRFRIEGLSDIWNFDDEERIKKDNELRLRTDNNTPRVAKRLMLIMAFFFLIFFGLGIFSVFSQNK